MTETLTARRAATRDRLVDAAIRVFAEKGVLGASVEEICEAAGFTRGAFYSNFSSKDDLCIAVLDRQISDQMSALDKALAAVDIAPTTDIDALMRVALEMFFASRPTDRDWVLTGQELRLHAARSPSSRSPTARPTAAEPRPSPGRSATHCRRSATSWPSPAPRPSGRCTRCTTTGCWATSSASTPPTAT